MPWRLQAARTLYLPGDECTWRIADAGEGKHNFIFVVDSSTVAPGATLYVYNRNFDTFQNNSATTRYEGFSPGLNNDLRTGGREVRVTFAADAGATAAAGPRVTLQEVPLETGLSPSTLRRIIFSAAGALIFVYLLLAYIAHRRFAHQAIAARNQEERAARFALPPPCNARGTAALFWQLQTETSATSHLHAGAH